VHTHEAGVFLDPILNCVNADSSNLFIVPQYPLFTLLAYNHHDMGLPIAWSIQKREIAEMIGHFLQAVKQKCIAIRPSWMPNCFIIDCVDAEVVALQAVFPRIPIYFFTWHIRR
jgi:hypothetical protein